MTTYAIVRRFQNSQLDNQVIEEGLTLEEAKTHCNDPETSSKTCKLPHNRAVTEEFGEWFDSFEEE